MGGMTLNDALDHFKKLNDVDKEYFLEIARKQLIELKRNSLSSRVSDAEANYSNGDVKSGGSDELFKDLTDD